MWLNVSSKGWLSRWHQSLPWKGRHNFLLEALRFESLLQSRRLCVAVWIYETPVVFMESVCSVVFQNLIFVCLTNLAFTTKTNKGEKMFMRRSFSTKAKKCYFQYARNGIIIQNTTQQRNFCVSFGLLIKNPKDENASSVKVQTQQTFLSCDVFYFVCNRNPEISSA